MYSRCSVNGNFTLLLATLDSEDITFFSSFLKLFSSVPQLCLTLRDPMDCSRPGFPVHQQLPEFTQTHVHWVNDTIQPSNPLLSPFAIAFNLSQHQGLFQWVSSSHQVAKVLELPSASASVFPMNIQGWLPLGLVWSCSPRDSQKSFPAPQFKSINSSALSLLYSSLLTSIHDYWKNHSFDYKHLCWQTDVFAFQYIV